MFAKVRSNKAKSAYWIITSAIIGLLLGIWFHFWIGYTLFWHWEKLSPPPEYVFQLFSGTEIEKIAYPIIVEIKNPCEQASLLPKDPPENITGCVQIQTLQPESYWQEIFVRDGAGNIWKWQIIGPQDFGIFCLFWPLVGLFTGVGIPVFANTLREARETSFWGYSDGFPS